MILLPQCILNLSSSTRLARLAAISFGTIASLSLVGCLTPPPRCSCDVDGGSDSSGPSAAAQGDGKSVAEKVAALELVPVVPSSSLIWDGQNISLINIDPPGSWYAFNDATPGGEMVPPDVSAFEDHLVEGAIHTAGKGYREWGGGIGMNMVGSPMLTPIDATGFKGIKFKAWGKGWVHVGLGVVATMPEFEVCGTCYDHFAVDINLSEEPKMYEFTWDKLKQAGWGSPKTDLDPATIVALTFTSRGATQWDFHIDDVGFIE